jgi:hypothetical protein
MKSLVVVRWYTMMAVYADDELVFIERNDSPRTFIHRGLMRELVGFEEFAEIDLETHDRHPELMWDHQGWWVPPETFSELTEQIKRRDERLKRKRIASLKDELRRLMEGGE